MRKDYDQFLEEIAGKYQGLKTPENILQTGFQIYEKTGSDVYLVGIKDDDNLENLIETLDKRIILTQRPFYACKAIKNSHKIDDYKEENSMTRQLERYQIIASDIVYHEENGIIRHKKVIQIMHLDLLLLGDVQDFLTHHKITYTSFVPTK